MKDLAHRLCDVPMFLEVLGQSGVVASVLPPVRVKVIQSGRVRPAARQEGRATRATERLLRGGQRHEAV